MTQVPHPGDVVDAPLRRLAPPPPSRGIDTFPPGAPGGPPLPSRLLVRDVAVAAAGIVAVGGLDYVTGLDLRIYPLYFLPVAVLGWRAGKAPAIAASAFAIVTWELASRLSGLRYPSLFATVWNVTVQGGALAGVAVLFARMRGLVARERALSRVDGLTGLDNARAFYEVLAREAARTRRHHRPLVLAYLDLDNFKQVNDHHGHDTGDAVLVAVAGVLREGCRSTDCIARLGGDEFALLLPETSASDAEALLKRLQRLLAAEMSAHDWAVSASLGALALASVDDPLPALVRRADALMYGVKSRGKNGFRVESVPPAPTPS